MTTWTSLRRQARPGPILAGEGGPDQVEYAMVVPHVSLHVEEQGHENELCNGCHKHMTHSMLFNDTTNVFRVRDMINLVGFSIGATICSSAKTHPSTVIMVILEIKITNGEPGNMINHVTLSLDWPYLEYRSSLVCWPPRTQREQL